ncbi:Hint domain-containing protein [Frigidibacter sp. RF13]|uniref:Hint domain-containing protein n=1 Tax=Frigidibacter sp. RF13 TaxID=2997340 RepID=UPI0022705E82|nr:Hint domain-containing protein [Frigidibacter sp. RF13]MCY1125415.1 Hint domain-containing protein [Frigidibacter sp. RF13]
MPCLTSGTLITTLRGEKPVEQLVPGDRVVTRDDGLQTVRSVRRRDFDYGQLGSAPQMQPVLVTVGAVSRGLPERELLVSPSLRILTQTADRDQLVAAGEMTDGHAIRTCSVLGVRYVHIGFDRDEVILANGIWVEAFQLAERQGDVPRAAQTEEYLELFASGQDSETVVARQDGI